MCHERRSAVAVRSHTPWRNGALVGSCVRSAVPGGARPAQQLRGYEPLAETTASGAAATRLSPQRASLAPAPDRPRRPGPGAAAVTAGTPANTSNGHTRVRFVFVMSM